MPSQFASTISLCLSINGVLCGYILTSPCSSSSRLVMIIVSFSRLVEGCTIKVIAHSKYWRGLLKTLSKFDVPKQHNTVSVGW